MDQQEMILKMENRSGFLHVHTRGKRSQEVVQDLAIKVFNAALEEQLSKVLVDVRELFGHFGFMDIYFLVREVIQDLNGKGVDQVAVIDIRRTIGLGWFLETVAQSYGLNIRVFDEEEPALKWLGVV